MVDSLIAAMKPAPPFGFTPPAKTVNVIEDAKGFVSLSYRFDLPHGSIAFTGDTGPSDAVDKLAKGVDLLMNHRPRLHT